MAQVQIIQPYQPQSDALEKVAAYCRVSTDTKDQLNSYRTQIGYYTNFIAQHPGWELADIYADAAVIIGLKTLRLKKCQKHAAF